MIQGTTKGPLGHGANVAPGSLGARRSHSAEGKRADTGISMLGEKLVLQAVASPRPFQSYLPDPTPRTQRFSRLISVQGPGEMEDPAWRSCQSDSGS